MPYLLYEKEQRLFVSQPSPSGWALVHDVNQATEFDTQEEATTHVAQIHHALATIFSGFYTRPLKLEVIEKSIAVQSSTPG